MNNKFFVEKLKYLISLFPKNVFLRKQLFMYKIPFMFINEKIEEYEFRTFNPRTNAGSLRLNRALKKLQNDGLIVKMGHGIYCRAKICTINGKDFIFPIGDPMDNTFFALKCLGVKFDVCNSVKEYNEGKTEQIPVNMCVRLKSRFRGEIYPFGVHAGKKLLYCSDEIKSPNGKFIDYHFEVNHK